MSEGQASVLTHYAFPDRAVDKTLAFIHTLRHNGYHVGIGESEEAVRLMCCGALSDKTAFQSGLKSLLSSSPSDWDRFDEIYDAFWRLGHMVRRDHVKEGAAKQKKSLTKAPGEDRIGRPGLPDMLEKGLDNTDDVGDGIGKGASRAASVMNADLSTISDEDQIREAHEIAERMARRLKTSLTRRYRISSAGYKLDMRRTIHSSLRYGGIPIDLAFRARREKPLKPVIFLDVSGSMNLYTTMYIRFIHGILQHCARSDAFIFHTRLVHIASALREEDPVKAMERLSVMTAGWSGGTRIGECLDIFNRNYAAQSVDSRSVAIIISDGFDTGETGLMKQAMKKLKGRVKRVIWLNPLAGRAGYKPETAGMAAALPYIDLFAPANSLKKLAILESYLAGL